MRLTVCAEPGCPELTATARCDTHRKAHKTAARKRYPHNNYGPGWAKVRARQLRVEPDCRTCGQLASVVDHIVPIHHFAAPAIAHHDDNLQSMCPSCHNRKTATIDSAFGRHHAE